jgi:hypothetical protein
VTEREKYGGYGDVSTSKRGRPATGPCEPLSGKETVVTEGQGEATFKIDFEKAMVSALLDWLVACFWCLFLLACLLACLLANGPKMHCFK